MPYAICTVPAAPVRKEASHRVEMVNQLLFGETLEVLEEKEEWVRIRSLYDDYEGWLTNHLISATEETTALAPARYVASGLVNPVTLPDQLINIPMGSSLTGYDPETRLLWEENYKYHGTVRDLSVRPDNELLLRITHAWLNAPYLWGGKTFMGVDCSGFVQTVFKVLGIKLPRDAWQQAEQGERVEVADAQYGDLAFFKNENGRIIHVGIMLGNSTIVHASGKVRIDTLDPQGIRSRESGRHTHSLHSLRRYF